MEENTIKISHLLFMILMMGIVIIVGTYAWLSYRSNDTAMVLTIGEINNVQVTLSPYQIKASLLPQVTYTSDNYVSVTAVNNSTTARSFRLFYKINSIGNELISSDFKYTIERSIDGTTYSQYKTGNFSSASNGGELTILEERITGNNTTYHYKVYLWIDGTNSGQSYMQGKSFNGELRAEIASSQYQFVEYLKNTGTQFIDTGYTPNYNNNINIEIVLKPTSLGVRYCLLSNYSASNNLSLELYNDNKGRAYYNNGSVDSRIGTMSTSSRSTYIFDYDTNNKKYTLTFNNDTITNTMNASGTGGNSMLLFVDQAKRFSTFITPIEIYSLKISENSVVLREMTPCYRKSDGTRGMYDSVNDVFYANAGSGTFEIGPEV